MEKKKAKKRQRFVVVDADGTRHPVWPVLRDSDGKVVWGMANDFSDDPHEASYLTQLTEHQFESRAEVEIRENALPWEA